MGMYTELLLKCKVKSDIPEEVKYILDYLFNNGDTPPILPEHSFFKCTRWEHIGNSCSYYHIPWESSMYKEGYIFSRSDLKNYDNEINLFLNWINPYIDSFDGDCIGYKWYEEDTKPTLLYFTNNNSEGYRIMKIELQLVGCDDTTVWEKEITGEQFDFLSQITEESKEHSKYGCMPTLKFKILNTVEE